MVVVMVMFRARQNAIWNPYRIWKNSMPKLHEMMGGGGDQTKIYCQGTICPRCVLSALCIGKFFLTKVGNQAKPLKYSQK